MVETGVQHQSSRAVRWVVLATVLVIFLVVYGLCVPFRSWSLYIDRRTGSYRADVAYFGILIQRNRVVATPMRGDPNGKGPLTAPEKSILVVENIQRFFWSELVTTYDQDGYWYAEAFHQMFHFASVDRPKAKTLSDGELAQIVKSRIPFWNSAQLDNDPQGIAQAARQENSDLLGVAVDHFIKQ